MKILTISKKQIIVFFLFLSILASISFYSIYATNSKYSDDDIFCISSLSDFSDDSSISIQEKIDKIYSSKKKVAYLTFDDGPTKVATPKILDILKEEDIKATFFVIGYRVEEFPGIVKRAYEEGHLIANHTYSHQNAKLYQNKESFINEIKKTDETISNVLGFSYSSHLFRFPNGSTGNSYTSAKKKCKEYLKELNYSYVDWNALNQDSIHHYNSSQLLSNLKNSCKNKDSVIVLMHDTVDVSRSYLALQDSIHYLKEQCYTFKTFEDLLQ